MKIKRSFLLTALAVVPASVVLVNLFPTVNANPAATTVVTTTTTAHDGKSMFQNDSDKLSYTIGVDLGSNMKRQGITINPTLVQKGIMDAQHSNPLALTNTEMSQTLKTFQQQIIAKQMQNLQVLSEKNKKEGETFLLENKAKAGVVVLPSGLQYKVLTAGTGNQPTTSDSVTVEYTGRLVSGKVFDSSDMSGKPVTVKVTDVIPGWTEALQKMKVGDVWEVYIPSQLAYGARGLGGPIGPNSTLIFKIHLVGVNTGVAIGSASTSGNSTNTMPTGSSLSTGTPTTNTTTGSTTTTTSPATNTSSTTGNTTTNSPNVNGMGSSTTSSNPQPSTP